MPGCDDRKLTLAGTIGMVWRAMNMAMSMPRPHVAWLRVGNAGWNLENQVIKLELPDNRVRGVLPSTLGLVAGGEPRLWPRQSLWRGTRNMKYTINWKGSWCWKPAGSLTSLIKLDLASTDPEYHMPHGMTRVFHVIQVVGFAHKHEVKSLPV